ncbi:sigma-54-dependent Fis family transcriptional regulator [Clostridium gelidum]|uniref:Sigma-54-dependent Fis family transcriptional regulator n=1 Tax=Clostridium gelidum TaxID=704125 RepID=A0ABM7T3J7_9CLOT|nr:sigma-54-dependent Fis family transcriptional regulator [Clostridium gelidum]BCZ46468.1 sigma-54-dependent Fis family transcriptional regulator [Clostridium gelidum]
MEDYIKEAHKRSISKGILLKNSFSTKILDGFELENILDKNKELILVATPFINKLYNFVRGSGFFAVLCDREGCILNVIGDEKILDEASELKMIKGAYMDEAHIGTNAMSLVVSEQIPIQISGKEHLISAYHKWTCSAAPIKDINGDIIGSIDLTGYIGNAHPHTLGMVVAAADAIEKMLKINKYNLMLEISKKRLETTFNSISLGILTCDLIGNITTMNKQATRMFGYREHEKRKIKIPDMIQNWNEIIEHIKARNNYIDEDIYINTKINKVQYALTLYPIYNSKMNIEEITIIIHELKKSKKFSGKILNGQAIYTFEQVIGKNEKFMKIVAYAKKIADSKSTVLITGESGTGKEVFAQAIHNYSIRNDDPFIAVNCGAIPRTLIESELFGYEDGAFTGAKKGGSVGKFEIAEGGTVFLDEIGEMPIDMQVKLLRVIEAGVITRIGSSIEIPIDVRIIAATNRNLKNEVESGNFRKDLYYRLNVLPIYLPPLREHSEDIPEFINYYMEKISKKLNKQGVNISNEYMKYLIDYDWPGNVRELENVIELMINSEEPVINFGDSVDEVQKIIVNLNTNVSLELMEKQHIIKVLQDVKGNMTLAANILEIGRNTLYRKIEKFDIDCSKIDHCSKVER